MADADPSSTPPDGQPWWRARLDAGCATRFFKYSALLLALLGTLYVVFDGFSYYVARRSIDAELESKKISSLEYLSVLAQRDRALVIATLETRCLERAELALFRIFEGDLEAQLQAAYNDLRAVKDALVDTLKRLGPGLVNVDRATGYVNSPTFTIRGFKRQLEILPNANRDDEKFKKLMEEIDYELNKHKSKAKEHTSLLKKAEDLVKGHPAKGQVSLETIKVLEGRLKRLKEERAKARERLGDLDDVMSRYAVWTEALSRGVAQNPILDEMAYEIGLEGDKALGEVKCNRFTEFYRAIGERLPAGGKNPEDASIWHTVSNPALAYRGFLANFFRQPPAAQTLFVTLALGALGALTLNVLRLSKVGWWAQYKDPLWGEIIVSPLLGALAAFGIYLIGSAGLLLTSDMRTAQSGVTPLSAFFIGLLGFISGLLYDEAFGRVRRLGMQLFAERTEGPQGRPEDNSLADALKQASASRVAELVLKYGVGTRLGMEKEFTFLVPSDEAIGLQPLQVWLDLNNQASTAFETWYHGHHATKSVTKKDPAAAGALEMDDGTALPLAVDGDEFKIGGVRVLISDLKWGNGIIHILSAELAP